MRVMRPAQQISVLCFFWAIVLTVSSRQAGTDSLNFERLEIEFDTNFKVCNEKRCWDGCTVADPCTALPDHPRVTSGEAVGLETSQAGHRMKSMEVRTGKVSDVPREYARRQVQAPGDVGSLSAAKRQDFKGIGGAFTDATAINLERLPRDLADQILQDYYGDRGAKYSVGRVPMASCDFSTRQYTYQAGKGAPFQLAPEDLGDAKTPDGRDVKWSRARMIKRAQELRKSFTEDEIKLFASPWTAPPWMKAGQSIPARAKGKGMHHDSNGSSMPDEQVVPWVGGKLMPSAYDDWAAYFARFFKAYESLGIKFWGLTVQNEPDKLPEDKAQHWETMFWTANETRDFVKHHLGPVLHCEGLEPAELKDSDFCDYTRKLQIIVHDDQKPQVLDEMLPILADADAMKYVSGVGLHWYMAPPVDDIDFNKRVRGANEVPGTPTIFKNPSILDKTYQKLKELRHDGFLFGTEACNGFYPMVEKGEAMASGARLVFGKDATTHVVKGSFQRGETYAEDILADMSHFVSGWTDWNLVLDEEGGPNWASNNVDAPILVTSATEYIRQPMFYYLAHFSRFMPQGSWYVATSKKYVGKPGTFEFKSSQSMGWPGNVFIEVFYNDEAGHFILQVLNRERSSKKWMASSGDEAIWADVPAQSIQTVIWKPSWLV